MAIADTVPGRCFEYPGLSAWMQNFDCLTFLALVYLLPLTKPFPLLQQCRQRCRQGHIGNRRRTDFRCESAAPIRCRRFDGRQEALSLHLIGATLSQRKSALLLSPPPSSSPIR